MNFLENRNSDKDQKKVFTLFYKRIYLNWTLGKWPYQSPEQEEFEKNFENHWSNAQANFGWQKRLSEALLDLTTGWPGQSDFAVIIYFSKTHTALATGWTENAALTYVSPKDATKWLLTDFAALHF